jgi:hypothetical protein
MDLASKAEKLRDIYEEASSKGRMNPEVEDEIDQRLMEVEERVNPTGATTERWWRWGVGIGISLVVMEVIFE